MNRIVVFLLQLALFSGLIGYSQEGEHDTIYKFDTLTSKNLGYELIHYHILEREKYDKFYVKNPDAIFDSNNSFSILKVNTRNKEYTIPTIPLSNLIVLENKDLIIGLSNYIVSPYNIVIYSLSTGDLLYKRKIAPFDIIISSKNLSVLIANIKENGCIQPSNSFQVRNMYRIELNKCVLDAIKKSSFKQASIVPNLYFPRITSTIISKDDFMQKYTGFFNSSNPLSDVITIDREPYLLILNSEDGKEVYIPLVSNYVSP